MNGSEAPIARNTSVNGEIVTNVGRNFGRGGALRAAHSAPERGLVLALTGQVDRREIKEGLR